MKIHTAVVGVAVCLFSLSASARDWFVRAGSDGDGSQSRPFSDPWQALDACQSGDVIHVAGGKYFGRLNSGMWEVPVDDVQLLGGYSADFSARDPWKNVTQLLWDKTSKNRPKQERLLSTKKGTVVDGFTFDQRDQCPYETDEQLGRKEYPSCDGPMRFALPATVRNCVIVNPGFDGIVAPAGSTIENNLVVNAVNWGININSTSDKQAVATVKNNTIAFTMSFKEPGKGAYNGSGLALKASANVTGNLIAFSDSNGIYMTANAEKTTLDGNVFFMNLYSNLKYFIEGKDIPVDDKNMEDLEEIGFKKVAGNEVKNPQLPVDPAWLDHVSKRTAATPGKLEMDDFNKARQVLGLPMIAKGGSPPSGVAPAMDLEKALKLLAPKSAGQAGARVKPLTVSFQGGAAAGPEKSYKRVEVSSWLPKPESAEGQALELVVAVSSVANVSTVPAPYKASELEGVFLHEPTGSYGRFVGFYKKGSSANRAADAAAGYWQGSGTPPKLYLAKGTVVVMKGFPKAGFAVDSLEPYDAPAAGTAGKPQGRDWFVRAGASGGDGSREKPFKDPWQALEKVEAGDSVHVAEGEYFGKLKTGRWKIDTAWVSLIGGYDKDFKERNPWKHPTRLFAPADYKGRRDGYVIEGSDDHTGAVVDGFVFDRTTDNKYKPNGDLDYDNSEKLEHLWLSKPGCVIRNNLFVNGAEGALRVGSGITVENNIFVNHHSRTVAAQRGFGNAPLVFRNNTLAFSWDIRFGQGNGRNGHLLSIENGVNAIIDNNIFEFADNDAIRLMADPGDVELTNNTFSHNLWSNVMRPSDNQTVDDKTFGQLKDFKFKKLAGNQAVSAGLPVDQKWFDAYLSRTAYVPGKVTMDDWNQLRELIGQPVLATGGKAPEGFAPNYPWAKALQLFPKNPKVTAGARAKDLPVSFTGVKRETTSYDYQDVTWADAAKSADTWDKLDGKRVAMKVVVRNADSGWSLNELSKDQYAAYSVTGPEGTDSGGLPMRVYVKKGSATERVLRNAKAYSSGTPEQWYTLKGVARGSRQLVVEVAERAD
jgi:hypothetical protein